MGNLEKIETEIEGLYLIKNKSFQDNRGSFSELYQKSDFFDIGIECNFIQDNFSKSKKGVLRGLHFQREFPQAKLITVIKGQVYDVVVDLRKNSKTYGKYCGVILSEENELQLFVPRGFAHGFLVISDEAEIIYKCDEFYKPEDEAGIIWNDNNIAIQWPIEKIGGSNKLIMSEKDKKWGNLE